MDRQTADNIVAEAEAEIERVDWVAAGAAIASISVLGIFSQLDAKIKISDLASSAGMLSFATGPVISIK